MIELVLPWPPSVNHYWRRISARQTIISKAGRDFREEVRRIVAESGIAKQCGALAVKRILYCPDWRVRDEDNLQKALNDSLVHAGAIEGDEFICASSCEKRKSADKEGRVVVQISRLDSGVVVKKSGAWLES